MSIIQKEKETGVRYTTAWFDQSYTIYEDGRVWSDITGKFLKTTKTKNSTIFGRHGTISRIIWISFHGDPGDHVVVSFKDKNPHNAHLNNLYIRARSDVRKESSIFFDDKIIKDFIEMIESGVFSREEMADYIGCTKSYISRILNGTALKWISEKHGPFNLDKIPTNSGDKLVAPVSKPKPRTPAKIYPVDITPTVYLPGKVKCFTRCGSRKTGVIETRFNAIKYSFKEAMKKMNIKELKREFNLDNFTVNKFIKLAQS